MTGPDEANAGIIVRGIAVRDIPVVHDICAELGYQSDQQSIGARINDIVHRAGHAVFVAADDEDRPVGFIHVFGRHAIEIEPCAQVEALAVGEAARQGAAGALLMGAAEQWARAEGFAWISLYCASTRDAAHQFYHDQGYDGALSATRFIKKLT